MKRDYNAKGDGTTQDIDAFISLSAEVNVRCNSEGVKIIIPPGLYIVGRQTLNSNGYRFFGEDVLKFQNCTKPILVEGYGAILKFPNGLRFGSFNSNGTVYNPASSELFYP